MKRYLETEKLTARMVWEQVRGQLMASENGYLASDDTVRDHNITAKIELVGRQYSGNAHAVIKGIGVVTCVVINPDIDQFWIIEYRIYDPERDGKNKLDRVREMLDRALFNKALPLRGVLMASWYAERKLMLHIERLQKVYQCPLKANRQVNESGGERRYQLCAGSPGPTGTVSLDALWDSQSDAPFCRAALHASSTASSPTDYIVTNDLAQASTQATQEVCDLRWKIEQFHRETKQTTGIEGCQCRLARIQHNHIACDILVSIRLKHVAHETARSVYQLKEGLLGEYLRSQFRSAAI